MTVVDAPLTNRRVTRQRHRLVNLRPGGRNRARGGVTPVGLQRRVQALIVIGWGAERLDHRAGLPEGTLLVLATTNDHIALMRHAAEIDQLFHALSFQPPTGPTEASAEVTAARAAGHAHGWVSALGWDEGAIDDPAAIPVTAQTGTRRRIHLEDVEWLASHSPKGANAISADLGITRGGLRKALRRKGRAHLWHVLARRDEQGAAA